MYGNHQHCFLCRLSRFRDFCASFCCCDTDWDVTLDATCACCVLNACSMVGGSVTPGERDRPRALETRMVRSPVREMTDAGLGSAGVGVVDREEGWGVPSPELLPPSSLISMTLNLVSKGRTRTAMEI